MDAGRIIDVACRPWPNTRAVQAERILSRVFERDLPLSLRSRAINARGVWSFIADPTPLHRARELLEAALSIDPTYRAAAANLAAISQENASSRPPVRIATLTLTATASHYIDSDRGLTLARMLRHAGCDVTHFVVRIAGGFQRSIDIPHQIIDLESSVCESEFQGAVANTLRAFNPDVVLLSGHAVHLPHLAAAASEFPYVLGPHALDLCAMLEGELARARELVNQATPLLCSPGTMAFDDQMRQAIWDAEEVLVCTPEAQTRLAPYARSVRVVPWGIDSAVFTGGEPEPPSQMLRLCIVPAGRAAEPKLDQSLLRQLSDFARHDSTSFCTSVLSASTATGAEPEQRAQIFRSADIIVFPSEAADSETTMLMVEAMACGRPLVVPRTASTRYLVSDGVEGMMFEPAYSPDLARILHQLASDARLRQEMGAAARRTVLRRFDWQVVIERGYRPVLRAVIAAGED